MPTEESLLRERHQRQEEERRRQLEAGRSARRRLRVRLPADEDDPPSSITQPEDRLRVINEIIEMTSATDFATSGEAGGGVSGVGVTAGVSGVGATAGVSGVGATAGASGVGGNASSADSSRASDDGAAAVLLSGAAGSPPDGRVRLAPMDEVSPTVNRWLESARKRK